jgi:hypothetical protein
VKIAFKKPYSPSPSAESLRMHVDERDKVALAAQQQKRRNLDVLVLYMAVCVTTSMAAARIYRENLPKVITSHNRLCLCL